ncbi:lysophospholipid acyltransferase family protein [Oryzicola mucosus]|nr:lysophospholipid acyltransferase family protein [Oryzicola mucosus]
MRLFRTGLGLAFALLACLVLVPLQMISMKTGLWPETVILKIWHRCILIALGIRVTMKGRLYDQRPLLVVSNHISWTDICVLGSKVNVTFIAKAELSKWPMVGGLSRLQRTVFIERERKRKSGQQASEIAQRLGQGDAMVLFAEGTTSDGTVILPFKSTLFGAATMALAEGTAERVFIQPVSIAYTRLQGIAMGRRQRAVASWVGDTDLATHAFELLAQGGMDVELTFGEPIEFAAGSSRKEATRIIEARVREMAAVSLRNPI